MIEKKRIENLRNEILEDISLCGEDRKAIIFYYKKDGLCVFEDYELLQKEPLTREDFEGDNLRPEKDEKDYQAYLNELKTEQIIYGTYNIIYKDEFYEITTLKEVLYVVCEFLFEEDLKPDALALNVNFMLQDEILCKLAPKLGITRQAFSQFLDGKRAIPKNRKQEIADFFGFDVAEFEREKSKYIFLEEES